MQLTLEDYLPIIQGRLERLQMRGAALPVAPHLHDEDAVGLHLLVEQDAPWLLAQVRRLVQEQAADRRAIATLKTRLGEAEKKISRQAGALTTLQQAEGRRVARGRRP